MGNLRDTAAGPDDITNEILKLLPEASLRTILAIINHIWKSRSFPEEWREATIIPIPKPGKDHSDPNNYRPISLTSCICKLMERLINNRLMWYLEKLNLLNNHQCGARQNRSTIDQLVRLDAYIREALARNLHAVAVFFDIEVAYDTAWKYGVLRDLHEMGVRGNLLAFVRNYLTNRTFRVRLGASFSGLQMQEQGFPQGGVLAVTLFLIRSDKMPKQIDDDIFKSQFVDDLNAAYAAEKMATIERKLQVNINRIYDWATSNGFKMALHKTKCIHFCKRHRCRDPELYIAGHPIPVVLHHVFLGLTFDKKLTYKNHITDLKGHIQPGGLIELLSSNYIAF